MHISHVKGQNDITCKIRCHSIKSFAHSNHEWITPETTLLPGASGMDEFTTEIHTHSIFLILFFFFCFFPDKISMWLGLYFLQI